MTGMFNRQAMQTESAQNRKGDAAIRKVARLIKSGQGEFSDSHFTYQSIAYPLLQQRRLSSSLVLGCPHQQEFLIFVRPRRDCITISKSSSSKPDRRRMILTNSPSKGLRMYSVWTFSNKTPSHSGLSPKRFTLESTSYVSDMQRIDGVLTVPQPTPAHYFVNLLAQHQILEKIFTQNIDTLEQSTGLSPDLIVEAHGSFAMAHCLTCGKEASTEYVLRSGVRRGEVVRCARRGCNGLVKPDIVFFGEGLPDRFHNSLPVSRLFRWLRKG